MPAATEVWSTSFGLVLHMQHIFANCFNILQFLSPEGYRLQFSITHAYFVYTDWRCTGQHCILCMRVHSVCMPVRGDIWWVLLQLSTIMLQVLFIIEYGIARFLCAMPCMYSKFGHHPHPLGYHCAILCLFRDLNCWASHWASSPWRKIAYSLTHPAYLMPREPKLALPNIHVLYGMLV